MNWGQFEDPISHMPLAGAMVASWSLTQEVTGSNSFTLMTNILVTEFSKFNELLRENSNRSIHMDYEFPNFREFLLQKKLNWLCYNRILYQVSLKRIN